MAGAEEVVAALEPPAWRRLRGPCPQRARATSGCSPPGSTRLTSRSRRPRASASGTRTRPSRRPWLRPSGIVRRAAEDGIRATATISVAFGCPFEGPVDSGRVLSLAGEIAAVGAAEVVFADTIGVAVPTQVEGAGHGAAHLDVTVGVHLHNTRNTGDRVRRGGARGGRDRLRRLGRRRWAAARSRRNATGNVATEDLVYIFRERASRRASTSTRSSKSPAGSEASSATRSTASSTARGPSPRHDRSSDQVGDLLHKWTGPRDCPWDMA